MGDKKDHDNQEVDDEQLQGQWDEDAMRVYEAEKKEIATSVQKEILESYALKLNEDSGQVEEMTSAEENEVARKV
jgi:hypothetical protein